MDAPSFVHLHCHSHYSLLDGASPIKKLVARAKEQGMSGLALTDHGNLYGALEFYQACKAEEINPIVGYEAYIAPGSRFDKGGAASSKDASYHLTLLAQNAAGFRNLVKLSSKAYLEGFYHKPRIDKEILAAHSEGIICLSGCVSGELSRTLLSGNTPDEAMQQGEEIVGWFHKTFGDRYFLEIQNNGVEIQRAALELTVDLANRMGMPLVATSDAHYVNREDAEAQDVLLCINTGRFRTDTNRMKMEGDQFYLRSGEEMLAAMPDHADAIARSQQIADTVDLDLNLGQRHFPTFTAPGNAKPDIKASEAYLRELVIAGLKERYQQVPERWQNEDSSTGELSDEVMVRIDRELGVINKLGFPDYFLIVWDFVRFAVEQDIPCDCAWLGRGVAGLLRAENEPRLPAAVRFAVRTVPGRKPPGSARYRYRLLQGTPRRSHSVRQGQVWRSQRRADWHLRHAGRAGGDRTWAARCRCPFFASTKSPQWCPSSLGISLDKALETSDELKKRTRAMARSASCSTSPARLRASRATSAPTPRRW